MVHHFDFSPLLDIEDLPQIEKSFCNICFSCLFDKRIDFREKCTFDNPLLKEQGKNNI